MNIINFDSNSHSIMTKHLPILALVAVLTGLITHTASAGGTGYSNCRASSCAVSKFQTPRYDQSLPYRHFQDRRRYNGAPCCGYTTPQQTYLIKTVVVRKERAPHYYTDSRGVRQCRKILTVTYKDIYSDGSCRVWAERA